MTDFFDYFKSWFRKAETSTPSNPALHEVIERDASYKAEFEAWKESLACRRIMDWLWHQYAMWVSLPNEVEKSIDFLDTPSSKGFAIHYSEEQVPARECRFSCFPQCSTLFQIFCKISQPLLFRGHFEHDLFLFSRIWQDYLDLIHGLHQLNGTHN